MLKTLNKYPKIGRADQRKKNVYARCKCGAIAKYKVVIQWDWMRGNDDVVWACKEHKKDVGFLTDNAKWQEVKND